MPRLSRNLLLIAAFCWVAPAAAAQLTSGDEGDCADAQSSRQVVLIADDEPGGIPISAGRRALLP